MTYTQIYTRKIQLLVLSGTQPQSTLDTSELVDLFHKYFDHSVGESSREPLYTTKQIIMREKKAFDNIIATEIEDLSSDEKESLVLAMVDGIVRLFCDPTDIDVQEIWNKVAYFVSLCNQQSS